MPLPMADNLFGVVRFPDKEVKTGDTWSGSAVVPSGPALKGVSVHFDSTIAGFEMYQNLPCVRVETNFTYTGPLPELEIRVRKQVPKRAKVSGIGVLTGSQTTYYALDRGWPLNDQIKLTLALSFSVTLNGQTVDVGGTSDAEVHIAATGYPDYDPSLVPKTEGASAAQ